DRVRGLVGSAGWHGDLARSAGGFAAHADGHRHDHRRQDPPSPSPSTATVPDVVGLTRGAASAALQGAGFVVSVVLQQGCDPADPSCTYRKGVVWSQDPVGGRGASTGSTVRIVVNP